MGSEYQKLGQTDLNKQDIQPSEIYQPDQRKPLNIIKTKVYCFHEKETLFVSQNFNSGNKPN